LTIAHVIVETLSTASTRPGIVRDTGPTSTGTLARLRRNPQGIGAPRQNENRTRVRTFSKQVKLAVMETWRIKVTRSPAQLGKLAPVGAPVRMLTASWRCP
jgi:hypothetical protein